MRNLVLVLGDQLDRRSAAFDGFDATVDRVWMAEARHESEPLRSSLARIALFLACMRHFRDALRAEGVVVEYHALEAVPRATPGVAGALIALLRRDLARLRPAAVVLLEPGDFGLGEALRAALAEAGVQIMEREDRHFLCSRAEFAAHARGRKQLRMEFFYREMRRRHRVLLDAEGGPEGGEWNFDAENRKPFGREGPGALGLQAPLAFPPDEVTRGVLREVKAAFADHPGALDGFDWPVTRAEALRALDDFVAHRLAAFGDHQDAMWQGEPWLFHSRISAALNLKLLDPREVIAAVEAAYRAGRAPLTAAEGFIRQVLGWREYVRGVYWLQMPDYLGRNALGAREPLPALYWTGDTDMACLRDAVGQTLRLGYAHHIQRLMVTGLFALLVGVDPREVHRWYLAVYVDAHEWVELPNTLGMSQYADGGVMASKPYIASGRYIARMGNHCAGCRYDPGAATGAKACPFTTLYWDFLLRHETALAANPRMVMQVRNLRRLDAEAHAAIRRQAAALRAALKGA
ncbi:MAG: cryptochrome/photolyase family protein [Gammaproteobacteria bacterium]|nr:cryptochrome/photolyase family protein [Gammaproteobacteria bacterium]